VPSQLSLLGGSSTGCNGAPPHLPAPLTCPRCGDPIAPDDQFCGGCGISLVAPRSAPLTTPATRGAYSAPNQKRILAQCPHATDVRGFKAWLDAGRVVRKGQKGIRIIAPVMGSADGTPRVVNIRPAYVFDISQTDALTPREHAA
jgi:hypothetical protein